MEMVIPGRAGCRTPWEAEVSSQDVLELGTVSLVQLQPSGLIVDLPESAPVRSIYDETRRVEVDRLEITQRGISATLPDGDRVLDIHHLDHPAKAYDDDDLVSVGFTAHYEAMRAQFGPHMGDGVAGENIVIDYSREVWPDDLGTVLAIENQDSGVVATLALGTFAAPCVEFSRFCAQQQFDAIPTGRLGEILRFLGNGRRGYLLVLGSAIEVVTVRPGDRVFLPGASPTGAASANATP